MIFTSDFLPTIITDLSGGNNPFLHHSQSLRSPLSVFTSTALGLHVHHFWCARSPLYNHNIHLQLIDIAHGLNYLHLWDVVHGDFKGVC